MDTKWADNPEWLFEKRDVVASGNLEITSIFFTERLNQPFKGVVSVYSPEFEPIVLHDLALLPFIQNNFTFPQTKGKQNLYPSAYEMIVNELFTQDEEQIQELTMRSIIHTTTQGFDYRAVRYIIPVSFRDVGIIKPENHIKKRLSFSLYRQIGLALRNFEFKL